MKEINKYRLIETKYDSSCFVCRVPMPKGSKIWWRKGERVRCDDCTPPDDRFSSPLFDQRDRNARERRDAYVNLFVWKYKRDDTTTAMLEELKELRTADEIHELIAEIDEIAEPVRKTMTA